MQRRVKELARKALAERIAADITAGLTDEQIEAKYPPRAN